VAQRPRGQGRSLGDGLIPEPNREGLGLESSAVAPRAGLGELVLAQEDADVLFVTLLLETLEERQHGDEAPSRFAPLRPPQQEPPVRVGEVAPRTLEWNPSGACGVPEHAPAALVPRLGPGIEGALRQ